MKFMKIFSRVSAVVLVVVFMFGLVGPLTTSAATTPSLGAAATYGILAGTYTNTVAGTTINGDVGYTTGPAVVPTVNGNIYGPGAPTPTARTDAGTALTNLNSQACTFTFAAGAIDLATDTTHGPIGVYTPGVYCTSGAGAASIGAGGITLTGSGTFIFRINGAFTTVANSLVTLANAAASCDVFWTPTAATTLGANNTFTGTIIDNANAITVGANTTWRGRALSLGAGTITTNINTVNTACVTSASSGSSNPPTGNITVTKLVINDSGGTRVIADFPLFVNGISVISGVAKAFPAPAPRYDVTETTDPNYTRTFSGDCDVNGGIGLNGGDNKFCVVTNNDIGPAAPVVPPLIEVVKVPSPLALPAGPGPVTYTYTLRNIGTVPVTDVTMVGDTCAPIVRVSGDTNGDNRLDVSETWVHTCSTTLSATHTNIVTATGWANGISAVDIASATVVVGAPIVPPLIHVVKVPSPLTLFAPGGPVTYGYTVTNPGTAPLSNVTITDDKCTGLPGRVLGHPGDLNKNDLLESNEAWSFTCQTNLTQTTTNTGTAEGTANGLTARDFAVATVIVANVFPGLPSTGIALVERTIPWNTIVPPGLFAILISYYFTRRRLND